MRSKLHICYIALLGFILAGVSVRAGEFLFFVNNSTCLLDDKGTSVYSFAIVAVLGIISALALMFIFKSTKFSKYSNNKYSNNYNLLLTLIVVISLGCAVYSGIANVGYFTTPSFLKILFIIATLCFAAFIIMQTYLQEKFFKNKYILTFAVLPLIFLLFRLVTIFLFYTNNSRRVNTSMEILLIACFTLFFVYYSRVLSGKNETKMMFITGIISVFIAAITIIPPILTVRIPPVYNGNTIVFFLYSFMDLSIGIYIFVTVFKYCKIENE